MKIERRTITVNGITHIVIVKKLPYMGPKKDSSKVLTAVPKHENMHSGIIRHGYKH